MAIPGQVPWAEKADIYSWFETGDFPTEAQFRATWDSYFHKSDKIAMGNISGLVEALNKTVSLTVFNSHLNDTNAHSSYLAKLDASNLSPQHVTIWRNKLGIGALPPYVATIDYVTESGLTVIGNAYKKLPLRDDGKVYVLGIDGEAVDASNIGGGKVDKVMNVTPDANKNVDISGISPNWTGQHRYSMLSNKRNDATYTRLIGADGSGNMAEVGLYAMTQAMVASTDEMKDAWRIANMKSTENFSIAQPRIDFINPPIAKKLDGIQYISLIGLNLFVDNQSSVTEVSLVHKVTKEKKVISNFQVFQTNTNVLTFGVNMNNWTEGEWEATVKNQIGITSLTSATSLEIYNEVIDTPVSLTWEAITDDGSTATGFTTGSKGASLDGTQQNVGLKSSKIISQDEMQKGVTLIFNVRLSTAHDFQNKRLSIYQLGLTNLAIPNNPLNGDISLGVGNVNGFNSQSINFLPNQTNSFPTTSDITDTLYINITGSNATLYLFTSNKMSVKTFNTLEGDLGLKLRRNKGDFAGGAGSITLLNKYVKK